MATAGSLIVAIQKLFGDPDGNFVTATTGVDWLNRAQRRFCNNLWALDEIKDYVITSGVKEYDLPTNCIIPESLMWYQSGVRRLMYSPPDMWSDIEEASPNSTGSPETYTVIRGQLVIGPQIPGTTSATSTASGEFATAAATFGLTAASGTLRSRGYVKCGTEIIEYSGITSTTLTGCLRGRHGTTDVTHASQASVFQVDLQMRYRKVPTELATTTDSPSIPEAYHDSLEKYVLYLAWLARGDSSKAQVAYNEFDSYEKEAKRSIGRRSKDGLLKIKERVNQRRRVWW